MWVLIVTLSALSCLVCMNICTQYEYPGVLLVTLYLLWRSAFRCGETLQIHSFHMPHFWGFRTSASAAVLRFPTE